MPRRSGAQKENIMCGHPGEYAGMCFACGQRVDLQNGVKLSYIHKRLRLCNDVFDDLRERDLQTLIHRKKLYLVLDLDHTLLNSSSLPNMTTEELRYLNGDFPDNSKNDLFRVNSMQMMTKLRPSVRSFLKEASNLFEMSIYTMGERDYALQMAKFLDPEDIYFNSIIAKGDSTQRHRKGLDVFMGDKRGVIILDDTESVWRNNKDNLILMERYHFFASSCKEFGFNCKSLSELRIDESETEGALMTVLKILKEVHSLFFVDEGNLEDRDVREVLKSVRKKILKDCKIVFTRVAPTNSVMGHHPLWRMAEEMGAVCSTEVDASVTHVVSRDARTMKSRWAVQEKKCLVDPMWIEACNYLWRKQSEESFAVRRRSD